MVDRPRAWVRVAAHLCPHSQGQVRNSHTCRPRQSFPANPGTPLGRITHVQARSVFNPQTNRALTGFSLAFYFLLLIPSSFNDSLELRRAIVGILGLIGTLPGPKCCHNSLPHCAYCFAAPLALLRRVSPLFRTRTARSHRPVSRERMATRMDSVRTSRGWLIQRIRVSCSLSSMKAVHVRSFPSILPFSVLATSIFCCRGSLQKKCLVC